MIQLLEESWPMYAVALVTIGIVEILKRILFKTLEDALAKYVIPISVFIIAGAVNLLWSTIFTPTVLWRDALAAGFQIGLMAGGGYSLAKKFFEKPTDVPTGL